MERLFDADAQVPAVDLEPSRQLSVIETITYKLLEVGESRGDV